MDFLYVLYKETHTNVAKIGSTRNPVKRLNVYKTSYMSVEDNPLKYDRLYSIDRNCYDVDELLKQDTGRGFDRLREIGFRNCGTEFYRLDGTNLLELWMQKHNIGFLECSMLPLVDNNENLNDLLKEMRREAAMQSLGELRGYQIPIYNRLVAHLQTHKRASLDIFCGGGKTVLYQKFLLDNFAKYNVAILVVPTLNLLGSMAARFRTTIKNLGLNLLQIGSHKGGTTRGVDIAEFLKNNVKCFIISTYQSAHLLSAHLKNKNNILMIFDECHHCCTKDNLLDQFKCIDDGIRNMIFATATPKFSSKGIGMNQADYFGEIICNIPMVRLIKERFLCEYQIIVESERISKSHCYASLNILKKYIDLHPVRKVLLYTNSISNIGNIYDTLTKDDYFNKFALYRAHSKLSPREVGEQTAGFIESEKTAIMVNCQLFTEGINVPELDCVVFCDPKNSESEIIQCFGRALRRDPSDPNKIAKIFIPICKDDVDNKFDKLINIIRAISTQDPKLRDEIQNYDFRIHPRGNTQKDLNILKFKISKDEYEILNLRKSNCIIASIEDAILHILRDYIPRTAKKISQEIEDREIYSASDESCAASCDDMFQNGKLKRCGQPPMYYVSALNDLTMEEFIQKLISRRIETEEAYHMEYGSYSDPNFPIDPKKKYKEFEWKSLLVKKYYTLEECMRRLKELEMVVLKRNLMTDREKNNYISEIDTKIPKNAAVFYKKNLYYINDRIFEDII